MKWSDHIHSSGLYTTFWRNCRVNASHFGKRSLGAFLQWVAQHRSLWDFVFQYLIFKIVQNTAIPIKITHYHLRFASTPVRRWGAMRHQERVQNRQDVRLSTWSVLQLLFAEMFVKMKKLILIGNIHMILQILYIMWFYFMIVKCNEKNRWIRKIV